MKIFALSDIHGSPVEFEAALKLVDLSGDNMLILCGDYIHGYDSYSVLDRIMKLQSEYGAEKVVALLGNHEESAMNGEWPITDGEKIECDKSREDKYISWMNNLPRYYKTDTQIFCHAGVCEEAGEYWEWSTNDYEYTSKYPAEIGKFCMDIIAGHIGTASISRNPQFNDIYWDGKSHYYIDGSVLKSGKIPVLMYDTDTKRYYRMSENGAWPILAYNEEY